MKSHSSAAQLRRPHPQVAKVDDDAFLHLPNLLGDLRALRCKPHLYYGSIGEGGGGGGGG